MKSTHLVLSAAALLTLIATKPAHAEHAYDDNYCREYTRSISIGGRIEEGYGRACLQQDGSWKVVLGQDAPRLPTPRPRHDDHFDDNDWNAPVVYYNNPRPIIYMSERPDYYVVRDRHHHRPKCHKHRNGHHGHGRGHDRDDDDDFRWDGRHHWD